MIQRNTKLKVYICCS